MSVIQLQPDLQMHGPAWSWPYACSLLHWQYAAQPPCHHSVASPGYLSSYRCALADHGVLLGAGVSVLGPIHVGAGAKVGAGSVVVTDLPNHSVAVGVPAKIIRYNCPREPSMDMDAVADFKHDYQI